MRASSRSSTAVRRSWLPSALNADVPVVLGSWQARVPESSDASQRTCSFALRCTQVVNRTRPSLKDGGRVRQRDGVTQRDPLRRRGDRQDQAGASSSAVALIK